MSTAPADILVIADEYLLADALRLALDRTRGLRVIGTAGQLAEGVRLARARQPDVILADYRLPDGDVSTRLGELQEVAPGARTLVFTAWADEASLLRSMESGAAGYVQKQVPFEQLVDGIRRVHAGAVVVAPHLLSALARRLTGGPRAGLSSRELDVLQLVADGCGTREIAAELYVSVNTVRGHVTRILDELQVNSRRQAVLVGVQLGLIRLDPPSPQ